ncbi:MAG: hypothetical protein ACLQVI_18085 [Polyangiaceae bacterium]
MSDEKRQLGSSDDSSALYRSKPITGAGVEAAMKKKFRIWLGTAVLATIGTIAMSATARRADVSPPPTSEEAQAVVQLDQSDDAPPFGAFLGACNTDSDCSDGNTCNSFRKRGNHCTHSCEAASDCKGAAEPRCTKQNRCGLIDPVKTK